MIFRSQCLDTVQYPDAIVALQNLLSEALAICQAGDPALGAALAGFLDLDANMRPGDKPIFQNPAEARLMSYRMFVYAYSEATEIKGHELQAEKLRMCIASLSERLGGSDVSEKPQLHS
jgi:hypothetical protein